MSADRGSILTVNADSRKSAQSLSIPFTMTTVQLDAQFYPVQKTARPPSPDQPPEFRKKDGSLSKMRSHNGNIPILPQTKFCPYCPAKFTRTTHLNRHLKNHTNERLHCCDVCGAQFTRSDLLSRHKKGCNEQTDRTRRKACVACTESKIKCDRQSPCQKCLDKGKECKYAPPTRRSHRRNGHETIKSEAGPSGVHAPSPPSTFLPPLLASGSEQSPSSIPPSLSPSSSYQGHGSDAGLSHNSHYTTDTGTITDVADTANHNLMSMYNNNGNDMFQPFFSNVFGTFDAAFGDSPPHDGGSPDSSGFNLFFGDHGPMQDVTAPFQGGHVLEPAPIQPVESHIRHSTLEESMDAELRHYLHLFYTVFLEQMPIVHPHTFSIEGRPPILISAMQACGALYVKTRQAATFIVNTLTSSRESLIRDFGNNFDLHHPTSPEEQLHLIIALVLLQTVGLFHQKHDQRAMSYMYHGMLITMVKRSAIISRIAEWAPEQFATASLEVQWQEWGIHETAKRAIFLSYSHDICQTLYFALPLACKNSDMQIGLPCETALWEAKSASDWWLLLESKSAFGDYRTRLIGVPFLPTVEVITETRCWDIVPPPISQFGHWIVIHVVLRRMFEVFTEHPVPQPDATGVVPPRSPIVEQEIAIAQFGLHNWLKCWLNCPETKSVGPDDEPPFMQHPLPFYWVGQIALMAYQEGLPPFHGNMSSRKKGEIRLYIVKQWLKHIRTFLKKGGDASTLIWDELMRIRLQNWQAETGEEKDDGLLGFFPET